MRKSILIFLVVIVAIFTFNEKEIYKKDIRNRLVIQGIGRYYCGLDAVTNNE